MARKLVVASIVAVLAAPLAVAQQEYEFEALPREVDGAPLGSPVAIANGGTVLFQNGSFGSTRVTVYRRGQVERIDLVSQSPADLPFWWITDINARGEIVGNNFGLAYPYGGYVGQGFRRDHKGTLEKLAPSEVWTLVRAINDHGLAVGNYLALQLIRVRINFE